MIGAVLDQVQKLFGRAFLIAAFVPSLLAVASAVGLWGGLATLREIVLGWTRQGFQEATFTLLALLALVYLLAYVAYGIRSALHRLYQGDWVVWPLTALAVPLTARARRELRAADAALEEATLALDDPAWCLEQTFAPSFTPLVLHRDEARQRLNHSRDAYTMLLLALDAGPRGANEQAWREVRETTYWTILRDIRLVQANIGPRQFPDEMCREISLFAAQLSEDYRHESAAGLFLRTAVAHWKARVQAEWQVAWRARHAAFARDETWLAPTRLGNVAHAQEFYTFDRYGISLADLWPRLQHVLPDPVRQKIDDVNTYLDFTVIMSSYAVLEALVSLVAGWGGTPRAHWLHLVLPVFFLAVAWLFYTLAIGATEDYGRQVQAAVDLYRLKVLEALGIARPGTLQKEQEAWIKVRRFVSQGDIPADPAPTPGKGGTSRRDTGC